MTNQNQTTQSNPVLALFSMLALVLVFLTTFVGLIFYMKGNIIVSAVLAVVFSLVMFVFYKFAAAQKTEKVNPENKGFTGLEGIFFFVYIVAASFAALFSIHSINVGLALKAELKAEVETKLSHLNDMVTSYEKTVKDRLEADRLDLKNAVSNRDKQPFAKRGVKLSTTPSTNNVDAYVKDTESQVTDGIDAIKTENSGFETEMKQIIRKWEFNPHKLPDVVSDVERKLQNNYIKLQGKMRTPTQTGNTLWDGTFEYNTGSTNSANMFSSPMALIKQHGLPFLSIVFVLILNFLVLMPYLFKVREGKKKPRIDFIDSTKKKRKPKQKSNDSW